ncbi:VRR-NUC domain-domain-containing protein [Catenaria anguillulae PL171]|uniref:Fanconi-associated nuclease n=1 Tax=Catenaria anguillulae PL171 TaxID=765915 RepID=A0A1Y2HFI7_9FUNG|nr:VRR-NUC domain-domain-containing protein [Catenaria anguillulae PL171]
MYRTFLLTQVSTVLDTEPFLFTSAHVSLLEALIHSADEQAQCLLARLIQRKRCAWILAGSLQYREVPDAAKAVKDLIALGLLEALRLPDSDSDGGENADGSFPRKAAENNKLEMVHASTNSRSSSQAEVIVLDDSSSNEEDVGDMDNDNCHHVGSSPQQQPLTWLESISIMLNTLAADDLHTFHSHSQLDTGLPLSARPKKAEYVASLAKALHTIRSRSISKSTKLLSILYTCAPLLDPAIHASPLIRVPPHIANLFDRVARVYLRPEPVSTSSSSNPYESSGSSSSAPSASPTNPLATQVLVRIGQVAYPRYTCTRTTGLIWPTIHDLDHYEQALALMHAVESHLALSPAVEDLVAKHVRPRWDAIVASGTAHVTGLYWFQRYHAGWPLTLALEHLLMLLAKAKQYTRVVSLCTSCSRNRSFAATHARAANDPLVAHPAAQLALQKRATRLQVQLRIPFREQRRWEHAMLEQPKVVTFVGVKANKAEDASGSAAGTVQGLISKEGKVVRALPPPCDNGDQVHVEEYALREYFKVGGWVGKHAENSTLGTLFAMLLYEEMFMDGVPGVFETEYQNAPLDLYSDSFYDSRATVIDAKLAAIRDGHFVEILERVDAAERDRKPMVSGLSWDFSLSEITEIAIGIGGPALATILSLMARDPRGCRSGMPDLILWMPGASPPRVAFAEVKGPNDTLSDKQRVWMDVLIRAGCEVHLCLVREAGDGESETATAGAVTKQRVKEW